MATMTKEEKAKLKTMADYALVLHYCNGYTKQEARKAAMESEGEELYKELLHRNKELFESGAIMMF